MDREAAVAELTQRAQDLVSRDSRVVAVGLFGSLARREALPSSDADVLVVLRHHPLPRWFDRVEDFVPVFEGTALPVELFPYTLDELLRGASEPGLMRTALREAVALAGESAFFEELRRTLQNCRAPKTRAEPKH